jgi:hypothetical protein
MRVERTIDLLSDVDSLNASILIQNSNVEPRPYRTFAKRRIMKTCRWVERVVRELDSPHREGLFRGAQGRCCMKILNYTFYERAVARFVGVTDLDELGHQACRCDQDEKRRERRHDDAGGLGNLTTPPESEQKQSNEDEGNGVKWHAPGKRTKSNFKYGVVTHYGRKSITIRVADSGYVALPHKRARHLRAQSSPDPQMR